MALSQTGAPGTVRTAFASTPAALWKRKRGWLEQWLGLWLVVERVDPWGDATGPPWAFAQSAEAEGDGSPQYPIQKWPPHLWLVLWPFQGQVRAMYWYDFWSGLFALSCWSPWLDSYCLTPFQVGAWCQRPYPFQLHCHYPLLWEYEWPCLLARFHAGVRLLKLLQDPASWPPMALFTLTVLLPGPPIAVQLAHRPAGRCGRANTCLQAFWRKGLDASCVCKSTSNCLHLHWCLENLPKCIESTRDFAHWPFSIEN